MAETLPPALVTLINDANKYTPENQKIRLWIGGELQTAAISPTLKAAAYLT